MSPLSWSCLRRCSWFDGGLSIDCVGVAPAGGAAWRVADACRSDDDVAGGEGIVSISCFELAPLRKGFRDGRPRFSGDDGLSMPFEFLPCRPKTVPSRLRPPKLLFAGGGPVGRLVISPKHLDTSLTGPSPRGGREWTWRIAMAFFPSVEWCGSTSGWRLRTAWSTAD